MDGQAPALLASRAAALHFIAREEWTGWTPGPLAGRVVGQGRPHRLNYTCSGTTHGSRYLRFRN